jgi:DNA primase
VSRTYEQWAETHLNVIVRTGDEWMVRCVFHENEGSPSMQFNIDKGLFVCFSCKEGGGMKKLTRHLGLQYQDPGADINDLIGRLNKLKSQNNGEMQLTVLDEDYLSRYRFPTRYWGFCEDDPNPPDLCRGRAGCKFHRWLTEETIEAFDLGYDPLENAAIIPLRNVNGGLIGVIRRFLDEDVDIRYKYPKHFKRSKALFGAWLAEHEESDTAVLTEGSLDAISVWQAGYMGLAQYGSTINPEQIRVLLRLGVHRVVLFYDNDGPGRDALSWAKGWKKHKDKWEYDARVDLTRHFIVESVSYRGVRGSDPGSLTSSQIRSLIDNASPVLLPSS